MRKNCDKVVECRANQAILVETFFSNFNLDRTETLSAATLYSRHLAETTSRMNTANVVVQWTEYELLWGRNATFFFASTDELGMKQRDLYDFLPPKHSFSLFLPLNTGD